MPETQKKLKLVNKHKRPTKDKNIRTTKDIVKLYEPIQEEDETICLTSPETEDIT